MRALIDTCAVVGAMQKRETFSSDSQNAVLSCCGGEWDGFITAKALTDSYYLTHQKLHDIPKTRDVIARLCYIFDVPDTAASDVRNAILSDVSDFEDAVMTETALRSGIDCIETGNIRDYLHLKVPAISPEEFIGRYRGSVR